MAFKPRGVVLGLAGVQLADAAFNAIPNQWVKDDLDHLRFPENFRFVFPLIKSGSAAGLLAGLRWPRVGRVTTFALMAYFTAAMGFHARAKDGALRYVPAAAMLGWAMVVSRSCRTDRVTRAEPSGEWPGHRPR